MTRRAWTPGHPHGPVQSSEGGFTLIELIVVIVVTGILLSGFAAVIINTFGDSTDTIASMDSSSSAFLTGARFGDDVQSAATIPATSTPAVSRNVAGCGGEANVLLRLVAPSTDGSAVDVITYSVGAGPSLLRTRCAGATITAALASPGSIIRVVNSLAKTVSPAPVLVNCRATAGANDAPVTTAGDAQCRIVTMRVTTKTGYTFHVKGVRTSRDVTDSSPPVERRCTLLASDNANAYEDQPNRNFNDHDDYGGDGRTYMEDRNRSGWTIRAYLRFDLSSACQDTANGEPPFMPPGQVLTGANLKLTFVESARDSGDNRCDSTHTLEVLNEPWDATTLTWMTPVNQDFSVDPLNPPVGRTPGRKTIRHGLSTSAAWTSQLQSFDVLGEVNHWYPGVTGSANIGDWANYGWVMSSQGTCDYQESHKWMSKGANSDLSPHLVITWSE